MKLEVTTSPKSFELCNYILGMAFKVLASPAEREHLGLTEKQVEVAKRLHNNLKRAFLRSAEREAAK